MHTNAIRTTRTFFCLSHLIGWLVGQPIECIVSIDEKIKTHTVFTIQNKQTTLLKAKKTIDKASVFELFKTLLVKAKVFS